MLQAFVDESGSHDKNVFVMAGYLSTVERWTAFSTEWQRLLDMRSAHYRGLEYFKMREMNSDRDRERCPWFYRVIEKHALAAISVSIDKATLREAAESRHWDEIVGDTSGLTTPYFIGFNFITTGLAQHSLRMGINQPVDFVFDDESEKEKCIAAWGAVKRTAKLDVAPFLGDTPIYRDDKKSLPLQAADLWAYWVREWEENGIADGVEKLRFPWGKNNLDLLRLHMVFNRMGRRKLAEYASGEGKVLAINDFTLPPSPLRELKKD